ncbi:MAG TPA: hypothetical protein VE963_18275, partial [Reyranella sp.]|nr:hypothetical protein [Reyranella sp.]
MDKNEYAGFAAQLAARSERLRAGTSAAPSPPPPSSPAEEPRERDGLSRASPPPPSTSAEAPRDRDGLSRLAADLAERSERQRARTS